jgi:dethiobiotin synthetase
MKYFVTGIDTDSGKTLASAILCEALGADYWKPIQSGIPRDTDTVQSLVTNPATRFHPERHLLQMPASPHASAKAEGVSISLTDFTLPNTERLIVEGAGGCLVPINSQHFVIDIAMRFGLPVVLVADLYLGSINHTLLTASLLSQRNVEVKGIIFNGPSTPESESIILQHTGYRALLHLYPETTVTKETVKKYATQLLVTLHG